MILKNSMFLLSMTACFLSALLWSSEQPNQLIVDQTDSFMIASFNVRRDGPEKMSANKWLARKRSVEHVLKTHVTLPAIICLQEPILSQVQDIASFLPDYEWFGQGRGKQWAGMARNEYVPIFFDANRFNFLDGGFFVLNEGTANPFEWKKYGKIKRIATWAHLFDVVTQKSLFVYNVHLDHDYDAVRYSSALVLIHHINAHVKPDQMVFIAGDFNTVFDGPMRELFNNNGFIHARSCAQSVNGPVNTAIDWNGKEKYCIDHILIRPGINTATIFDYTTLNTVELFDKKNTSYDFLPSDHYPIFATITMN